MYIHRVYYGTSKYASPEHLRRLWPSLIIGFMGYAIIMWLVKEVHPEAIDDSSSVGQLIVFYVELVAGVYIGFRLAKKMGHGS